VTQIICGVDVSSETLDVRVGHAGAIGQYPRTSSGIEALATFCRTQKVTLIVLEATGGYERLPFGLLWQLGMPTAIVNPRGVRKFAEGMGVLEKTDTIDAGMIAWYAEVKRIVAQEPLGETQDRLKALVTRLRQLTEMRTQQSNQKRLVTEPVALAAFEELLAVIARQMRAFETQIAALIDTDPLWSRLDQEFRSIKGVADRTVSRLMAEMPEIGTLSGKAIAKLAGVAPIARDSGKSKGHRSVRGGRTDVRSILFVVAEVVRRHEPDFAAFHEKLSNAGKPKKLIRIAMARKLLVRLNAKARDIRRQMPIAA
jgi:transposase